MTGELPKADPDRAHSAPIRRSGSVRRTSSMEMTFPPELAGGYLLTGRARDALTRIEGAAPEVLAEDSMHARLTSHRIIEAFASDPPLPAAVDIVGQSALAGYRAAIAPAVAGPGCADRPLALLLDDMVGSSIISTWVRVRCDAVMTPPSVRAKMENVCAGYASGTYAVTGSWRQFPDLIVPPLQSADDPHGFHQLAPDEARTVRRVRRIDVWRTAEGLGIDAMFQDSGVTLEGERVAIHEYRFFAEAREVDGAMALTHLDFVPGELPYEACRNAPLTANLIYGTALPDLRRRVLAELRGTLGCTHLNDALRSLAAAGAIAEMCPA